MTNDDIDRIASLPVTLTPLPAGIAMTPAVARRVATLERRAPRTVARAAAVGVPVEYLGIAPLSEEMHVFEGPETDWTFGPYDEHEEPYAPASAQRKLDDLRAVPEFAKVPIYIGHEVQKERTKDLLKAEQGPTTIERMHALELVGPAPLPAEAVDASERYGRYAGHVIHGLIKTGKLAGGAAVAVAAAPVVLLGGALMMVDPILVAAIPAGSPTAGTPAAWYVLARWNW